MTDDQILLNGMIFHGHTGVLPEEKAAGQDFIVDVVLRLAHIPACETDDLADTVNYSSVYQDVKGIVERSRYDLIERLAGRIAEVLLERYPVLRSVCVTVRKPMAPIEGRFDDMAVAIERFNQERP